MIAEKLAFATNIAVKEIATNVAHKIGHFGAHADCLMT